MSVEDGNLHLPKSTRQEDVFDIVKAKHLTVGKTIEEVLKAPWEKVAQAAGDFFTASVAYLANRGHDDYMREVGTTSWWAVNQKRVLPVLADNMIGAAIRLGVPPEIALRRYIKNDEPHIIFLGKRQGVQIIETAYVLIPPEFIVKAQNSPIETLATMSWIGSQVRDMVNGRLTIDQNNINQRAAATEAHFLLNAHSRNPAIELSTNSKLLLESFPKGIYSLPQSLLYRGISGTQFTKAKLN